MERALSVWPRRRRGRRRRAITTAAAAIAVLGATGIVASTYPHAPQSVGQREVVIPFSVGPASCTDRERRYAVTMRIYNVLAQPVSIPTLLGEGSADPVPPGAAGRALNRLMLPCGRYAAVWNGRHISTGRQLAPGVYVYDLVIDGQRVTRKVTLER